MQLIPTGYVVHYQLCPSLCATIGAPGPRLCIPTALCKWLAGSNDFREKVTLRPLVNTNDLLIHFQVYRSR